MVVEKRRTWPPSEERGVAGILAKLVLSTRTMGSRVAFALGIGGLAILGRLALSPALNERIPWVTSFPAILLAALFGDVLAAIVTLLMCGFARFLLVQQVAWDLAIFIVNGGLVAAAGVALRRTLRSAQDLARKSHRAETLLAGSEEQLQQQVADLTRLHEFGTQVVASHDRDELLRRLLAATIALQGSEHGCIEMYDPTNHRLMPSTWVGHDREAFKRLTNPPVGEAQVPGETCAAHRTRVIVEDTETDPLFNAFRQHARDAGVRALWCTPLLTRTGELLGVLTTHFAKPRHPSERHIQLVELYARLATDVTEMKLLVERTEHDRFRLLVSSIRDYAIFMLDPEGRVATWNAGAEAIKGYREDEVLGKPIEVFYTTEDRAAGLPEELLAHARDEGRVEHEGFRVRKNGERFWADVVMTAMYDGTGKLTGFAKITRDLTERRALEQERLRSAHAEEAIRMRDEFISIASHELKTPLAALHLQLDMLRERVEVADEQMAKRFARATRSSEKLTGLVRTLLDVSRIATGSLELQRNRFCLADAVLEVTDDLHDAAVSAGCELNVRGAGVACGNWDRLRIEQVITNLIANAIKYAPGTPIGVTIRTESGDAVLDVTDGGPGIAETDIPRMFQRFERAASARHYGGLGLGLYVTRQIVEAHGGSVSARNLNPGGVLFSVRLPLAGETDQGAARPEGDLH